MKFITAAAWIFLGVDALLVIGMFISRNVGDDAAGRGMATGFAIVLTPVLLAVGALLFWASRTGSRPGVIAAFLVAGIPFWFLARNVLGELDSGISRSIRDARRVRYAQPELTAIARALRAGDATRVRELARGATLDFADRNSMGLTILGFAVEQVLRNGPRPENVEGVRALLDAGARPDADIMGPEEVLLERVIGGNTTEARQMLRLLLQAGAEPDVLDRFDRRPLVFSSYMDLPELELFAEFGADLRVLDTRSDRQGWSALMHMASGRQWDMALFLLGHGVPPDHVSPSGESLETILAGDELIEREDPGYRAFMAALAEHRRAGGTRGT